MNINWTKKEICFLKKNYRILSHAEIARKLGRKTQSIRRKCHKERFLVKHLSEEMLRRIRRSHAKFRGEKSPVYIHIPESAKKLTKEKAYLLGVIGPGDGCIRFQPRIYMVKLIAKDKEFVKYFQYCIRKIYHREWPIRKEKVKGYSTIYYGIYVGSQAICKDILRYNKLEHYREGTETIPKAILKASKEYKAYYLRGLFDSDGNVTQNTITLSMSLNLKLLKIIQKILKDIFSIESKIGDFFSRDRKRYLRILVKSNKNFLEQIGFTIKRKKEKLTYRPTRYDVKWSNKEITTLRRNYPRLTIDVLAVKLRRSPRGTRWKIENLGLKRRI